MIVFISIHLYRILLLKLISNILQYLQLGFYLLQYATLISIMGYLRYFKVIILFLDSRVVIGSLFTIV